MFDAPRNSVPQPSPTLTRPDAPRPAIVANVIQQAGEFGGAFRQGGLEEQARQDVKEIIETSSGIKTRLDAQAANPAVDVNSLPGAEQVEKGTKKFKTLAAALSQGTLNDNAVRIQADAEIKKLVNQAPGFAGEIRAAAARELGFDPNGAVVDALFDSFSDDRTTGSTRQTPADKFNEEVDLTALRFGISRTEAMKVIRDQNLIEFEQINTAAQIKRGEISVPKIASKAADAFSVSATPAIAQHFEEVKNNGGGVNTDQIIGILNQIADNEIRNRRRDMSTADGDVRFTSEQQKEVSDSVKETLSFTVEALERTDLQDLIKNRGDLVNQIIALQGVQSLPTIATLNAAGGQALVTTYLNTLQMTRGNERVKERLKQTNPWISLADSVEGSTDSLAPMLNALTAGIPAITARSSESEKALHDVLTAQMIMDDNPDLPQQNETRDKGYLARLSNPDENHVGTLSGLAQDPGRYRVLSEESRGLTQLRVSNLESSLVQNLRQQINPEVSKIAFMDGKFVLVGTDNQPLPSPAAISRLPRAERNRLLRSRNGSDRSAALSSINKLNKSVAEVHKAHPELLRDRQLTETTFVNSILTRINGELIADETLDAVSGDEEAVARVQAALASGDLNALLDAAKDAGIENVDNIRENMNSEKTEFFLDPETGAVIER